jgi:Tfp pilus assembly protein PilX
MMQNPQKGIMLIYLIIILFLFSILMLPVLDIVSKKMIILRSAVNKEQALQIAEAGINYYQWHLAHYPVDYKDGTNNNGPYVHDYKDFDTQQTIGKYSLVITPPTTGSTIVTIQSTGWMNSSPSVTRTITARFGIPSMAKYAFLSNDIIWIGGLESISGQLQSNNGIRFDGSGNAPIQSAKSTYTCGASQGCSSGGQTKNGVWGSASQAVQNFWQFPVPAVDFSSLTSDLAAMKTSAQSGGIYLPPSNMQGYSLVFNLSLIHI